MNENSRYIAGVDIGTTMVRCVVASINSDKKPVIVGVGTAENSGMKKGVVSHLTGPASAIDDALAETERTSGFTIDRAVVSINGSHILSTKSDGMIAVNSASQEVGEEDLARIQDVATVGKMPANRKILEFIPYSYSLDGQEGISDPFGMRGTRLEVQANVVSAMTPHVNNLHQAAEQGGVEVIRTVPSVIAASRAVLTEKQKENGVAVIDFGATTTGVAIFKEGDLQYLKVIPVGSVNITNDLAIVLQVTPEIAEEIKLKHAIAGGREEHTDIMVKRGREHYSFNTSLIDEIVDSRLEEIFDDVRKEFKNAGCDKQLPSGVVLVGGGANMVGIAKYAKTKLELASQVGEIEVESTISDEIKKPEFAAAVGLMLEGLLDMPTETRHEKRKDSFWRKFFNRDK